MHDNRSHPLLEQVPLTVSPFVQMPRATTLPYRYKAMPSALPPSIIEGGPGDSAGPTAPGSGHASGNASGKTPYVVSPANALAAHPDDILASCQALRAHLDRLEVDMDADLVAFNTRIQERELAEKRRVAPGWLDSEDRLLVPERHETPGHETPGHETGGTGDHPTFQLSEMAAGLPESATTSSDTGGISAEALTQAFGSTRL